MSTQKAIKIDQLLEIMAQLRDPKTGCPWDIKQDYKTIIPFTVEEVYEVADAIERSDFSDLKDELGDLLFQVIFYAQLAAEDGYFNLSEVVESITQKLIRRHPHVFGNKTYANEKEVQQAWEAQKQREREVKNSKGQASLLDDIPKLLPELKRSQKMQNRVAKQGFDWPNVEHVWDKLSEETAEVKQAFQSGNQDHTQEEIGDLLFVCVNLARHYDVDADMALRQANKKFETRFRKIEALANKPVNQYSLDELEKFWQIAKADCSGLK